MRQYARPVTAKPSLSDGARRGPLTTRRVDAAPGLVEAVEARCQEVLQCVTISQRYAEERTRELSTELDFAVHDLHKSFDTELQHIRAEVVGIRDVVEKQLAVQAEHIKELQAALLGAPSATAGAQNFTVDGRCQWAQSQGARGMLPAPAPPPPPPPPPPPQQPPQQQQQQPPPPQQQQQQQPPPPPPQQQQQQQQQQRAGERL